MNAARSKVSLLSPEATADALDRGLVPRHVSGEVELLAAFLPLDPFQGRDDRHPVHGLAPSLWARLVRR